ncbi:MAG TPA: hypothetical protein VED63_12550 [Acidimicrobiales bacterium]|nr:hypothetical protein [Acidimicrobiales bacterium]
MRERIMGRFLAYRGLGLGAPRHRTKVRQGRHLWVTTCSCRWTEETISEFSAWIAAKRHQRVTATS